MRDGRVSPCFFLLLLFTESLCSSSSSSSSSSALSSSLEHLALVYKPLLSPELLLSLDSNNNKKEHLEENRRMMLRDLEAAAKVGNNQKENALQFTRRQSFAAHPNATSTFCTRGSSPATHGDLPRRKSQHDHPAGHSPRVHEPPARGLG